MKFLSTALLLALSVSLVACQAAPRLLSPSASSSQTIKVAIALPKASHSSLRIKLLPEEDAPEFQDRSQVDTATIRVLKTDGTEALADTDTSISLGEGVAELELTRGTAYIVRVAGKIGMATTPYEVYGYIPSDFTGASVPVNRDTTALGATLFEMVENQGTDGRYFAANTDWSVLQTIINNQVSCSTPDSIDPVEIATDFLATGPSEYGSAVLSPNCSESVTANSDTLTAHVDFEGTAMISYSTVLGNDLGSGVQLKSVRISSTEGGTVTFSAGDILYSAPSGYSGSDSFDYTISDRYGNEATGTVDFEVDPL